MPDPGARVTTRVECADWFPVRDEALLAHATQIDPDEPLVRWCRVTCSARSGRPRTTSWSGRSVDAALPEDDLFAGHRGAGGGAAGELSVTRLAA